MTQNLISYQTVWSNQIYLNSSQADTYSNGSKKSNLTFNLHDVVSLDKNVLEIRISLVNAQFPYSFYQINSTNNKINIYYQGITTVYYFPHGNYNVKSFIEQWKLTIGTSYIITYSTVTNKFTFNNSSVFHFSDDVNSLFPIIGFKKGEYYIYDGLALIAPHCYNFNGLTRLNVVSSSFSVKNIDSFNDGQNSTIASIPINCSFGGIILYNNYTNYRSIINSSALSCFGFEILDDYENFIDFNNIDWTLTLQIDIVKEVILNTDTIEDIYNNEQQVF